jgi:hypothetical protein
MSGVPYTFGNATTSIPLTQLDANFNTTATLGNTAVGLGNTTTSVGNLTLTNTTVTNYTETYSNQTGNVTINLVNGTFQNVNVNSAITITLPSSVAGKSFTIQTYYTSNSTVSWAGGTSLKWAGNTTPTATAVTGKVDIFNFMQDGNVTYGAIFGQNY